MHTTIPREPYSNQVAMAFASRNRATTIGLVGLLLFALFGWVDVVNNDISIILMLSAAAVQYRDVWKVLRNDPLTYLFLIFASYILVMGYYSGLSLPETQDAQWEAVGKWLRIWLFLLIAWWLDGNTKRIIFVYVLAYIGFIAQVVTAFDWANWDIILGSQRLRLGLNTNATTLIAGIGIIGLFVSLPRVIPLISHSYKKVIGVIVVYLLSFIILIESMLLTQSRAAWIAVAISLTSSSLYFLLKSTHFIKTRKYALILLSFASIFALFIFINHEKISSRFYQEKTLAYTIFHDFDIEQVPYSSAGRRLHLWHFGFNRWLEKPLLGWGPGTIVTKHIKRNNFGSSLENQEALALHIHPHVHNAYLTTLARLGVAGGLLILAIFVIFNYNIWREYKEGNVDKYILFFYISSVSAFLIANIASIRLFSQEDRTLIYLILGSIYSYRLAVLKRKYSHPHMDITKVNV